MDHSVGHCDRKDSAYVSLNGQGLPATMTSMNVSMPQYVVTEQTVAATTHRGRMNAAASDLTSLATTAVLKVICVCLFFNFVYQLIIKQIVYIL